MWEEAPESPPAIRPGGRADDEGGPGDTPASVAWLRAGRGTGYGRPSARSGVARRRWSTRPGGSIPRAAWPETVAADRSIDGPARPAEPRDGPPASRIDWDTSTRASRAPTDGNIRGGIGVDRVGRADPHSQLRGDEIEPEPAPAGARRHARSGMSDWERWLEFCARIDGFPRHLSHPLGRHARHRRAAHRHRAARAGDDAGPRRRPVRQARRRGAEADQARPARARDAGRDRRDPPADRARLRDLRRPRLACPRRSRRSSRCSRRPTPSASSRSRAGRRCRPCRSRSRARSTTWSSRSRSSGPARSRATPCIPYLRRKQGLEPVTYLHPSLEPVLKDSMGVILYQEQVMRIAIEVAGFSPAESDGFRRAMGTWRSNREMEKLHQQFHDGCLRQPGMTEEMAEELFRQVSAFASFGFAKSHAAAFARTAYESSFLKLFYPAQFLVGLINAQPMGFYPVEVLVNDAKRHGVAVLPVDLNASTYKTTTEWVGQPGWVLAGAAGDDGSFDDETVHPGEELPEGSGIEARPRPVRSASCVNPGAAAPGAVVRRERDGLGRPARPAARQGHRRAARGAARPRARARAVRVARRRRRADGPARGDDRAADPDGRARLARPAAARAPVAAPGGRGRDARPRRSSDGLQARRERRERSIACRWPADGPAPARHRGAEPAPDHRVGAARATPTRSSGWTRSDRSSRCSARRSTVSAP